LKKGSVSSNVRVAISGLISPIFYVFATQPRFLSPLQLLVNKDLFLHEKYISTVQRLFKKSYLHFHPGESPRPLNATQDCTAIKCAVRNDTSSGI